MHHGNESPASPNGENEVFTRDIVEMYLRVLRGGGVDDAVRPLVDALTRRLEQADLDARGGERGASAYAAAKWQVYSALAPLHRARPDLAGAQSGVHRLLCACSVFELLPHPRFKITQDWFSPNVPTWERVLEPWSRKPNLSCLEIGSFEGLSACWLLEHALTDETSRITCVDPFDAVHHVHMESYFDHNVRQTGQAHKLTKLKGYSSAVLPFLAGNRYDLAYIDGSHHPADALRDALAVWPLVSPGGLVIFDDYRIGASYPPEVAAEIDPAPGIRAFLGFVGNYDVVHEGWQLVVRKR